MPKKINATIIGATGYTGLELIRLCLLHPNLKIKHVVSTNNNGKNLNEVWPHLVGICDQKLEAMNIKKITANNDAIFVALPHGESQKIMPALLNTNCKIIDLGGDFRLKINNALKKEFVYGLPEIFRNSIASAKYVANPGCFAITAQLSLFPLKKIMESVSILAVTGSSGAGKQPKAETHHAVRNHNLQSYKIGTHQHIPEILQTLGLTENKLTFVPTSGPFTRGIHLTAFVHPNKKISHDNLKNLFKDTYGRSPFVRIKDQAVLSEVVGSNFCDISVTLVGETIVVQAVIDNLVKGAAGTAIQNCNLMFGLKESAGLELVAPLFP